MDHVDKWEAERASDSAREASIVKWGKKNCVASASSTARCFFESMQAALFGLDCHDKLPSSAWGAFAMKHPRNMDDGVKKSDIAAFFNFLRAVKAPIDVTVVRPTLLTKSTHTVERLELYALGLAPGWYIVHAGQHDDEHCFALDAFGPFVHPCVAMQAERRSLLEVDGGAVDMRKTWRMETTRKPVSGVPNLTMDNAPGLTRVMEILKGR
jgi:hypothetical protein